jgi:hypothetical protein
MDIMFGPFIYEAKNWPSVDPPREKDVHPTEMEVPKKKDFLVLQNTPTCFSYLL